MQHGEAEPSCLWRSSKEWLMLVPSTRRRFTDLARRYVAYCDAAGNAAELAAKAATSTFPIVFAVSDVPVKLRLVASLASGRAATGINRPGVGLQTSMGPQPAIGTATLGRSLPTCQLQGITNGTAGPVAWPA